MSSYRGEPRRVYAPSEAESRSRTPAFLRREAPDPATHAMVVRSRKVEEGYSRRRRSSSSSSSSVSPDRRSLRIVHRHESPPREYIDGHARRARSMSRMRYERERSISPDSGLVRIVQRGRSPSAERFRATISERQSELSVRAPSPEPEPEPAPQVIKGPIIEREVITHWRDIDHGVIRAPRSPSPVAPSRRSAPSVVKDTDIDIDISHRGHRGHHHTDVDIDISHSHSRSPRRHRSRSRRREHFHDDTDVVVRSDRERLMLEAERSRHDHRSHSAAPLRSPSPSYSEEADYITSRIDARGKMGEAYHGHTKDWTIVDVPPGTERVRMDGVGGASADVTWSRYSGVRRAKFVPEREEPETPPRPASRGALVVKEEDESDKKLSIQITDKKREIEIETSRRSARTNDMWTEITKDLVCKEALDQMGYEFEETDHFYYIMAYLQYDDVVEIVKVSDEIREARRKRARELEWEREFRDHHHHIDITATHTHRHGHSHSRRRRSHSRSRSKHWDDDFERRREVISDRRFY